MTTLGRGKYMNSEGLVVRQHVRKKKVIGKGPEITNVGVRVKNQIQTYG